MTQRERETMTPMMQQYYELKAQCEDAVLFFRMGDFYEIFGSDAEEVAPILEIVLTSRERGDSQKIKFCGVPHHSAQGYWVKLLKLGYKVAIADQVEDAALAKGLVKRAIVKSLSPGCIDELEGLESDAPNYLMAAYEEPGAGLWAIALGDISTGELRLGQLSNLSEIVGAVELFKPKEILIRRFCLPDFTNVLASYRSREQLVLSHLPEAVLRDQSEQQALWLGAFASGEPAEQPCGAVRGGKELISALLKHCQGLGISTRPFLCVKPLYESECMHLGEVAIRDLEIFETARRRDSEGSLFKEVNGSLSPMGSRFTRWSLANPLLSLRAVARRHDALSVLIAQGEAKLGKLREHLKGLADVERLSTRILAGSVRPQELARIRESLRKIAQTVPFLADCPQEKNGELLRELLEGLRSYQAPLALLDKALSDEPNPISEGAGIFRIGYDSLLDEKLALSENGQEGVQRYLDRLRKESGIQSLKIKEHKTFGLVIEVTKSNLARVPSSFIRRQTMVNCERFVTMELKDLDEALASAKDFAVQREAELFRDFVQKLAGFREDLRGLIDALAQFDMLQGFAWLALRHGYCRPGLNRQERLILEDSRHPVVERFVGRHAFVANSVRMDRQNKQFLITGPNMAGKSTIMRQTAICAILNQAGSFIPARMADLPLFDQIYTRVGAADDLSRGLSTFMVEMSEAALILRQATAGSLVILDEVGRGTSSEDGLAIASAILEHLAEKTGCWAMFATHYHELVPLAASLKTVKTMQTEVKEGADTVIFTHRLIEGASGSSFGIEVAELAGIPAPVLQRAKDFLGARRTQKPQQAEGVRALPLIADPRGEDEERIARKFSVATEILVSKLTKVHLDRTTPLQALNILNELKAVFDQSKERSLFQDGQN